MNATHCMPMLTGEFATRKKAKATTANSRVVPARG